MSGKKHVIPAKGYTFQTLNGLNQKIWKKYKNKKLEKAVKMLQKSHNEVMALIERHNDDELFTKNKYDWTGTETLGTYLIYVTSDHYEWGILTIQNFQICLFGADERVQKNIKKRFSEIIKQMKKEGKL